MKCIVFVVMFLLGVISHAEAGMDEANEAYERGDYESAYREWFPLAEQGDAVPSTTSASCTTMVMVCSRTLPKP